MRHPGGVQVQQPPGLQQRQRQPWRKPEGGVWRRVENAFLCPSQTGGGGGLEDDGQGMFLPEQPVVVQEGA